MIEAITKEETVVYAPGYANNQYGVYPLGHSFRAQPCRSENPASHGESTWESGTAAQPGFMRAKVSLLRGGRGGPLLAVALAVVLWALMAAPARGNQWWTGETAATDPRSRVMQNAARDYWERLIPGRMAETCPGGITYLLADLTRITWVGASVGCLTVLDSVLVAELRGPREYFERGGKSFHALLECSTQVHETGHAIGLEHWDAGTYRQMEARTWAYRPPRECFEAARLMYPRDARRIKARWVKDVFG